jgi:two-component SAPR family response regulator
VAPASDLSGLKILVVEDDFLVAELLREILVNCGCDVVGPAPRVDTGLRLLDQTKLDGAVLDINLNGQKCFPIAAALSERSVPFVFLTGYEDAAMIPPEFREIPRLSKPVDPARLASIASTLFHVGPH